MVATVCVCESVSVCVCDWQAQLCFHQVSDTVIQPGTEHYSCHSRTDRANYWRNKEHTFTFPHDRLPTYTVAILIIFNVLQEISHHANVCDLSSVCTPQPYLSQLILTNLTGCPRKSLWEVCLQKPVFYFITLLCLFPQCLLHWPLFSFLLMQLWSWPLRFCSTSTCGGCLGYCISSDVSLFCPSCGTALLFQKHRVLFWNHGIIFFLQFSSASWSLTGFPLNIEIMVILSKTEWRDATGTLCECDQWRWKEQSTYR